MLHLKISDLNSGEYREVFCAPGLNPRNECTIGSNRGCDLVLKGADISSIHAKIVMASEGYYFIDLNSETGCRLNDQPIQANQPYKLSQSDSILMGNFFILVQ
jgi:predicted component of type VI protein secretion system